MAVPGVHSRAPLWYRLSSVLRTWVRSESSRRGWIFAMKIDFMLTALKRAV